MRWNLLVDELAENLRNGFRQIARNPGFTAIAVLTLALGIGANTALFSIFNSLILRPLPVRDPGGLALLTDGSWSYPIWSEITARETGLFDGTLAWAAQRFDLSAGGQTDPVDGAYVSGRLFDVLGVTGIRGRMLSPADDSGAPPDAPVAVISHRLWRQRFAGAHDVVGRHDGLEATRPERPPRRARQPRRRTSPDRAVPGETAAPPRDAPPTDFRPGPRRGRPRSTSRPLAL
jgi:putative ABC transport system permease protein